MKIIPLTLIFIFFSNTSVCAAILSNGGLGEGEHYPYEIEEWSGQEQIVTRLNKRDSVYEFVRISRDIFVIRQESIKGEIFFKFDLQFKDGGVIWNNGMLVDIFRTDEKISALMYGDNGYFLITATTVIPVLAEGQIFLQPKIVAVEKWKRLTCVWAHDYYTIEDGYTAGYPVSSKIKSARLVGINSIEFVFRGNDGSTHPPDVFTFIGHERLKNGEPTALPMIWNAIGTEMEMLNALDAMDSDKDLREKISKLFDGKDGLLDAVSNFQDKEIHAKIVKRVEKAFINVED